MPINVLIGGDVTFTTGAYWSTGSAPATGQDLIIQNAAGNFTAGLANTAVALATLNINMSFTGTMGVSGATGNTYLAICSPLTTIGTPSPVGGGTGSSNFNLDLGTSNSSVTVVNTASPSSSGIQSPVNLKGTSLTVNLTGGVIGIAPFPTETSTVAALNVASGSGLVPRAYLGQGCTCNVISQYSGTLTNSSTATIGTATIGSASLLHQGSGGFTILTLNTGGVLQYIGGGNIGTLTLQGTIDFSGGGNPVTIGATILRKGFRLIDPLGRVTFTTPPVPNGCSLKDGTIDRGVGRTF